MATRTKKYDVKNGPSKWDLMLGLLDNPNNKRRVRFDLVDTETRQCLSIEVCLNSIAREDGSGNSFCFSGFIPGGGNVHGWMRTTNRKGWAEIEVTN